ncbi:MAG: hypothetical protein AAGI52_11980 [Bacteroidota bacterium]
MTVRFVELSPFATRRPKRLADEAYRKLLLRLGQYPTSGEPVPGTDDWREVRWADRGGSKRGGIRTVRYSYQAPDRFYLGDLASASKSTAFAPDSVADELDGILNDGQQAPREVVYDGRILTEVHEAGEPAWHLGEARSEETEDVTVIRETLRQTHEGFADLLGVKLATVRNWELGRRQPRGPAKRLIALAATRPDVLLEMRRSTG